MRLRLRGLLPIFFAVRAISVLGAVSVFCAPCLLSSSITDAFADSSSFAAADTPAAPAPVKPETPKPEAAKPDLPKPDPAKSQPAPAGGTSAIVMDLSAIESVIGKSVKSSGGEDLGRIVDLLVTTSGQVRAAVIDFGGVLGVGSRKVAVDWKALDFSNFTKDGAVRLALTRNQVRVSPEYKSGDPVVILQATKQEEPKPEEGKTTPPASSASPPQGEPRKP